MVSTVQKSYRKNILREMKSSISRVVSLFGIVALGVMMLTGLMCIAPDMRTAAHAGIESVGVCWGFRPRAELEASGADHLAETPQDILPIALS